MKPIVSTDRGGEENDAEHRYRVSIVERYEDYARLAVHGVATYQPQFRAEIRSAVEAGRRAIGKELAAGIPPVERRRASWRRYAAKVASDPGFKARRAAYMRDYRARQARVEPVATGSRRVTRRPRPVPVELL